MAYWLFKCDPKIYDLAKRLADPEPRISWLVTRYRDDMRPGDYAFLAITGPERGIHAIMRIDEAPQYSEELPWEQPFHRVRETGKAYRVIGELTHRVPPGWADQFRISTLRLNPALRDLGGYEGLKRGTNFEVDSSTGNVLKLRVGIAIKKSAAAAKKRNA